MGSMLRSDPMSQCDMFLTPEAAFMVLSQLGEIGCAEFSDAFLDTVPDLSLDKGMRRVGLSFRDCASHIIEIELHLQLNADLNAFQRTYVLEVCRCADMERKLRFIGEKMHEDEIYIPKLMDEPAALELHEMNSYESTIEKWERLLVEMSANLITMRKTYMELTELSYVLTNIGMMLGDADLRLASGLVAVKEAAKGGKLSRAATAAVQQESGSRLTVITGLVLRKRSFIFQLMLWRIARGNAFYKQTDQDEIFKDPVTNSDVRKVAFLLVVQGDELGVRMKKVCEGFRCDLYPLPPSPGERMNTLSQLNIRIDDLSLVLKESRLQRCKVMRNIAKTWPMYTLQVKKAKAIYYVMNEFSVDFTKKFLIGRCWIPTADLDKVQDVLDNVSILTNTAYDYRRFGATQPKTYSGGETGEPQWKQDAALRLLAPTYDVAPLEVVAEHLSYLRKEKLESAVPCFMSKRNSRDTPPTFHRTNRFTNGFQMLISAYGDSTYRELNPGLYTIITFPFLFSLMFGDLGHGSIMLGTAVWMLINEKKFSAEKSDSEMWNILFGGRYIILLMSCFSIYAGLIYNDCFSQAITIFKSGWTCNSVSVEKLSNEPYILLELSDATHPYYYGVDPRWQMAENKILFENSLKMKLSIIIGVVHMIFGLILSFFNDIYFKKRYLIFLEFLPQMLFLVCIFLWLVFLIFFKWVKYGSSHPPSIKESQGCAPLVLILFIDMMLMATSKALSPECDPYMFGAQPIIQKILLFIALASIPIMLFGPPCFVARINKKKRTTLMQKVPTKAEDPEGYAAWEYDMEQASEPFSDLMIHQSVHTIEFVLSTVSHTASYLRLWALSLAHAQLSEMLWVMIFSKMALSDHTMAGGPKIVVVFAIWAFFTLTILVLMEGLSAFLHTLRLHWVEYMSKFFIGTGVMFKPFHFAVLFSDATKDKMEICPTVKTFDY